MKVIIAGSRTIKDIKAVIAAVDGAAHEWGCIDKWRWTSINRDAKNEWKPMYSFISEVVSGRAVGVDTLGERWADDRGIPIAPFPALFDKYGKSAGLIRNVQMADYADALIAVWDGKSRGTKHMIAQMKLRGKPVYVHRVGVDSHVPNDNANL